MCRLLLALFFLITTLVLAPPVSAEYPGWQHSGSMCILTTSEGANLPAEASEEDFPLLVRLDADWFDFSQAQPEGQDVRFGDSNGRLLAYEIEQWDPAGGTAAIWVRIPEIKGDAQQEIRMMWGNPDAKSESDGGAVFNESNGYLLVSHMGDPVVDATGTVELDGSNTEAAKGLIGMGRNFANYNWGIGADNKGKAALARGTGPHTTELWFRAEQPNAQFINWGGTRSRVELRTIGTPPRIWTRDVKIVDTPRVRTKEWTHVATTYQDKQQKLYVDGRLVGSGVRDLDMKDGSSPFVLGGWGWGGFAGMLDEVHISNVARSADWLRLQYENQKPIQTVVGPLVERGDRKAVTPDRVDIREGETVELKARVGGARKLYWIAVRNGEEEVVAVDRFNFALNAGRVAGDAEYTIRLKAVYPDGAKTIAEIPVRIRKAIPDPIFELHAPRKWNGRETIEVTPVFANLGQMRAEGADDLNYDWEISGMAAITEAGGGRLVLQRAQKSGTLHIAVKVDNGGEVVEKTATIEVTEPAEDAWVGREPAADEMPEQGQFYARNDRNEGTLHCNGALDEPAGSVFLRVYCDGRPYEQQTQDLAGGTQYAMSVKLKPGFVKYRVEFGARRGDREVVLHRADDIVCGDAYMIQGQSNALATDTRDQSPPETHEWVRSYGGPTGRGDGAGWVRDRTTKAERDGLARPNLWCKPVWKDRKREHEAELGWWGIELAKRLVESQKVPICIIQGAVGGTRIDEHLPTPDDHADLKTIYGRTLWRVRQARLTHGIRAVLWHQGESDQGADGPTGRYGWETYQQFFMDLSAAWKTDMPNIRHYYVFQIWPNACSMGNGHGDMLREIQRTLPGLYSNMDIMSTLGIRPPGPCHYPLAGWSEFASLIQPLIERDCYGKTPAGSITPPDLKQAYYASDSRDAIALVFDQPVVWKDALVSEFYLDDENGQVVSGSATGNVIRLKLAAASTAAKITYLKERDWSQDRLIIGANGIAALTFCNVPIEGKR